MLVHELKIKRKQQDFPGLCGASYAEISTLIDAGSTPTRSYALPLSSATGKDLQRILLLVVFNQRCATALLVDGQRNWFSWIDANRKEHNVLKRIDMQSWKAFRASFDVVVQT